MKLFLLLLTLSTLPTLAEPITTFSRQPYLQLATDNSIHILWRTKKDISARVLYGTALDAINTPASSILARTHPSIEKKNALFKDVSTETRQYEATLNKLQPATKYYYAIYDGDTRLTPNDESYHFNTHPTPGSAAPLYFWVVGDSGTGSKAQAQVHQAMLDYNAAKNRTLDLYLHVGDMAYGSGTNQEFSDRFFKMYEPTLRNVPCWPSMGNHEGRTSKGATGTGPYYDAYICPTRAEAGGLPSGKEAYYSFDYGNVHFICLDSHDLDRRPTGEMAQWLKADLEKTKAQFLVAFFHHPPYTKGSHDSDKERQLIEMREYIMPILESGGVDLIFSGHSHIYERSMLIDGAYHTPSTPEGVILDDGDGHPERDGPYKKSEGLQPHNGTIAVVAGHGGTKNRRKGTHPLMRNISLDHGSCLISIKGDTIIGEMLNLNGKIIDTFAIHKSGTVTHNPISQPWQPKARHHKKTNKTPNTLKNSLILIPKNAKWSYLGGSPPSGTPNQWTTLGYDASSWKTGKAGFGYSDKDDTTKIHMKGKFTTLYIRREFDLPENTKLNKLGLSISYDDAFIAYLNGHEIHRQGIEKGNGPSAQGLTASEAANKFHYYPLKNAAKILKPGETNILAIEGHNVNLNSSDFTLHPQLLIRK